MKRPKSVTILGERIKISYLKDEPLKDTLGLFDPQSMEIKILDTVYWDKTLFHEILHAALFVSGSSNLMEPREEEALVTGLEHALFSLYKRCF